MPASATELGRFRLEKRLGRGGQAEVWLARMGTMPFALKVIWSPKIYGHGHGATAEWEDHRRRARELEAEYDFLRSVGDEHVVAVVEFETDDTATWMVMEYASEGTLEARLGARDGEKRAQKLDAERVRKLAIDLLRGLDAAHRRGISHKDVKPSNIGLFPGDRFKLLDFGVANYDETDATRNRGTDRYKPPEVGTVGKPSLFRWDLFSVGVTLWEALTGRVAYWSPHGDHVDEAAKGAALRSATGDKALDQLIERLTQPAPEARPASAEEALALLGFTGPAPRPIVPPPPRRSAVPVGVGLGLGVVAAAAVVGGVFSAGAAILWAAPPSPEAQATEAALPEPEPGPARTLDRPGGTAGKEEDAGPTAGSSAPAPTTTTRPAAGAGESATRPATLDLARLDVDTPPEAGRRETSAGRVSPAPEPQLETGGRRAERAELAGGTSGGGAGTGPPVAEHRGEPARSEPEGAASAAKADPVPVALPASSKTDQPRQQPERQGPKVDVSAGECRVTGLTVLDGNGKAVWADPCGGRYADASMCDDAAANRLAYYDASGQAKNREADDVIRYRCLR